MPPDGTLPYVVEDANQLLGVVGPSPLHLAVLGVGQPSPDLSHFTPASTPPIYVDARARQVLALDAEADRFFGLLPGTNGTGPAMRRACVPEGFTWLASDCRVARGPLTVPTNTSDEVPTPWGFHAGKRSRR